MSVAPQEPTNKELETCLAQLLVAFGALLFIAAAGWAVATAWNFVAAVAELSGRMGFFQGVAFVFVAMLFVAVARWARKPTTS